MSKVNILVIPPHDAALKEYVRLDEEALNINLLYFLSYPTNLDISHEKVLFISSAPKSTTKSAIGSMRVILKKVLKKLSDDTSVGIFFQNYLLRNYFSYRLAERIRQKAETFHALTLKHGIKAIFIANDRTTGFEAAAQLVARSTGLPVYLLSFAYAADFKSSYKLRTSKIYKDKAPSLPNNVRFNSEELGDRNFYRAWEADALGSLGILSENPWVLGSGCIDKVFLDSERERARLASLGGEGPYEVTGLAVHDVMYHLNAKTNMKGSKSRRSCLVSLPQYYEHGHCDRLLHFKYLQEMLQILSSHFTRVVVSLHPKMSPKDYVWIRELENAEISQENLEMLIPAASFFVATYSSTVAWAIMCDVPIVLVDHIGLAYEDFYAEFNLPVHYSNLSLDSYLKEVALARSFDGYDVGLKQRLSPFDGNCVQRIENEILE